MIIGTTSQRDIEIRNDYSTNAQLLTRRPIKKKLRGFSPQANYTQPREDN
jgi:hypothetical protein